MVRLHKLWSDGGLDTLNSCVRYTHKQEELSRLFPTPFSSRFFAGRNFFMSTPDILAIMAVPPVELLVCLSDGKGDGLAVAGAFSEVFPVRIR